MVFQFSQASFEPWTIKQHFELTNNRGFTQLLVQTLKSQQENTNSCIYLYRAHAAAFPSVYCMRTHTHTHAEPFLNMVSWTANTDCGPYICLSFFFLLQTKPVAGKTNSNSHTSDETVSSSPVLTLFCASFHMCLETAYFHSVQLLYSWGKSDGEKKEKKDKRRLFGRTGLNMHWLLSQWQPRTISAYVSLWGTRTITTAILGWPSKVYTKLFILFPAAILNTKTVNKLVIDL